MEVIPAIEIKAGKSVLQTQGRIDQAHLFTTDPVKIAKRWADEGATRLHIHDVDGARLGTPENREIIRDIRRRIGVPVQYSGGVRSPETVERLFAIGVDRVVLTLNSMADAFLVDPLRRYSDRIIVAVVHNAGNVSTIGQPQSQSVALIDVLKQLQKMGALRFLLIPAGDANATAPDPALINRAVQELRLPILVYGKISTIPEIEILRDTGAEAAILGKSIYDNAIRFPHAIAIADPG